VSWSATVVTVVGETQPESDIWPLVATVALAGKLAKTWQSAWLRGLGACPEISAM